MPTPEEQAVIDEQERALRGEQSPQEPSAEDQDEQDRRLAERKAKQSPAAAAAEAKVNTDCHNVRLCLEKLQGRLQQGTLTEEDLAEIETSLMPKDEEEAKQMRADLKEAKQKEPQAAGPRALKPAEIGQPRKEAKDAQARVERMLAKTLEHIEKLQGEIASGNLSDEELIQKQADLEAQVNKFERLSGGGNPAAA